MKIEILTEEELSEVSGGLSVELSIIKADRTISAPDAATSGALTAFQRVQGNGVEIKNLDVIVTP